jgi:hypothetical protein
VLLPAPVFVQAIEVASRSLSLYAESGPLLQVVVFCNHTQDAALSGTEIAVCCAVLKYTRSSELVCYLVCMTSALSLRAQQLHSIVHTTAYLPPLLCSTS